MLLGIVIAVCVLLAVLAFVAPRLSHHAERGAKAPAHAGSRGARKAPGIGHWLAKPFESASKWMGRSARGGRKGRGKLPM
jgi:hypothetical protein